MEPFRILSQLLYILSWRFLIKFHHMGIVESDDSFITPRKLSYEQCMEWLQLVHNCTKTLTSSMFSYNQLTIRLEAEEIADSVLKNKVFYVLSNTVICTSHDPPLTLRRKGTADRLELIFWKIWWTKTIKLQKTKEYNIVFIKFNLI